MPTHNEHYGHDWALIQSMMLNGKHKKAENCPATYGTLWSAGVHTTKLARWRKQSNAEGLKSQVLDYFFKGSE